MKWNKFILSFLTLISCVSCGRPDTEYNNFYFQSSIFYFSTLYQYKTLWIKNYDQENKDYLNYKTNDDLLNLISICQIIILIKYILMVIIEVQIKQLIYIKNIHQKIVQDIRKNIIRVVNLKILD